MAAKRFLSLFKSSNKREKENNDPLMSEYQYHLSNGQRRSRRVNFQSADASSKRRSCVTEVTNDDDDGSEITLTASAASRQQHPNSKKMPPHPYLVVTEPKQNHGPRSCPGGGGQHYFDFDSLDNDDISGANGGTLDRSLEARSEFISNTQQQHRRSSRRRLLPSSDEKSSQSSHPFSEIGNGRGKEGQQRENGVNFGGSSRYKNIPWAATNVNNWRLEGNFVGKQQYIIQIREQQQEIHDLQIAYRDERGRRKTLQRELRREQEAKDRFQCENFRLQSIIGLLVQQQQQPNSGNLNTQLGIELNNLAAIMPNNLYNSWTGNTPSSSSAVAAPPIHPPLQQPPPQQSLLQPQSSNPWTPCRNAAAFDFINFQHQLPPQSLFGNVGGPGECLAAPILSSSSLISQQQTKQHQKINQQNSEDEIKIFRTGQHNTDSFSGSSRLTTGDLTEMEREKNDLLVSDVSSKEFCSSPEVERGGGNTTTTLHGLSFSVDDCQNLFSLNRKSVGGGGGKDNSFPILFPDVELPLRDDG
ncbi:unnamed protein product [Meloidogyne enterolobii]|uniref:Uncharacterized protein n=1 Tax=Meloidogyne enterolobii TaxID=390850 RepID=A0ACB0ZRX6_MELEN